METVQSTKRFCKSEKVFIDFKRLGGASDSFGIYQIGCYFLVYCHVSYNHQIVSFAIQNNSTIGSGRCVGYLATARCFIWQSFP